MHYDEWVKQCKDELEARAAEDRAKPKEPMSLTITEAQKLNTLLHYMLACPIDGTVILASEAREAATCLANSAYKRLAAGLDGIRVGQLFDQRDGPVPAGMSPRPRKPSGCIGRRKS